jgi:integrase
MYENENSVSLNTKRAPWNKGKLIGPRPPLRQKHVWAIRTRLQIEQQLRDLVLFNLAIDSKLRGCDVVAIRYVAPNGHAIARATVRQKKTGRPVRFELTEQTRQAINEYLVASGRKGGRLPVQWPSLRAEYDYPAVCAPVVGVAFRNWPRSASVRDAFVASYKGNPDLSAHGQPTSRSSWTHEDREHGAVSGHRR